jgi:uroporphyrin-III C-methyltransferase
MVIRGINGREPGLARQGGTAKNLELVSCADHQPGGRFANYAVHPLTKGIDFCAGAHVSMKDLMEVKNSPIKPKGCWLQWGDCRNNLIVNLQQTLAWGLNSGLLPPAKPATVNLYWGHPLNSLLLPKQPLTTTETPAINGVVYLVGAGPGDPDLLTLKAARLLQLADVVVYDNLVSDGVVQLIRPEAEKIYVGKQTNRHTLPQAEINQLLVNLARQGKQVVRLKGGDPFIFGRGGEELEVLVDAGVAFEVVPGITAASGVSCYAGIPLTHRDYAQSCVVTTGHLKGGTLDLDWPSLARENQTVVIYMGLGAIAQIAEQLIRHGMPADMPAAMVERGTTARQRVVTGTLATLPDLVRTMGLQSPSLIVVGKVVSLSRRLQWFAGAASRAASQ